MSIYGNPVTLGGSGGGGGGGGGNAYAYTAAPTAAIGSDGEYYFQLATEEPGMTTPYTSGANSTGGYRFQVGEADITVIGLRVKLRANITGTIKLGTSGGTLLASASASYNDGDWRVVMLDEPVMLEAGETYAVVFEGSSNSMYYNRTPITTSRAIAYKAGLTGSFPGSTDSGYSYSSDIIIGYRTPNPVKAQYYKSGGVWTEVT